MKKSMKAIVPELKIFTRLQIILLVSMRLVHVSCYLRKNTFSVLLCNLQKDGAEAEQAKKELPFTFKGK